MVNVHASNFASFTYTVNAEDTTAFELEFVTPSGNVIPTDELVIFVDGGTFAISDNVLTITPASAGKVSVLAVKANA